ncbi:MAG: DNA repair protein RecN [Ancrocorticia sp.]|uniref:DNA repair protein RecN n=1 Tax=Ancrocorticia sp. TaxID=2593684 RepID=UPI003F92BC15
MIEQLRISNLGVIESAELELGTGLTALTGETGAGKTMAVTSLELLLGAKADSSKVRRGAKSAVVEGVFSVPADSEVVPRIVEAGGDVDEEDGTATVIISRQVPASGRSRSFIGGRTVPTSVLTEIAGALVTVHGQTDQLRLATPSQQRVALDEFGGAPVARAFATWRSAWEAYNEASTQIEQFEEQAQDAARARLAYEALVAKVDDIQPTRGEEAALKREAQILENVDQRFSGLSGAAASLSGSDAEENPALAGVVRARQFLDSAGDSDDVRELLSRLDAAEADLSDIAGELADLAAHSEADPERLSAIYSRRQALQGLRKALGMDLDQAIEEADQARAALEDLGDVDATRERLEAALDQARAAMDKAGKALQLARSSAAKKLTAAVTAELPQLALPDATFSISVTEAPTPAAHGKDVVAFQLASHAGAPLAPLGKSASGGELSRIMLAVEVSLAAEAHDKHHTFLFDEIDAGVGGRAALAVGHRLAALAATSQVIVVTHLAQVAAYAGTQDVVVKESKQKSAITHVERVAGDQRLGELARMLAGTDSPTARAHAAELLSTADVAR